MPARTELGRTFETLSADEYNLQTNALIAGHASTLEDYRYRCGVIKGLELALEYLDQAERKVLRIEDNKDNE